MELPVLKDLFVIFALCVGVIFVCNRIKIPALVGFLITGVLCGPHGLGLVSDIHQVDTMAHVGIVLLLFSIGMELHLDMLSRLKKFVLIGGSAQALLTTLAVTLGVVLVGSQATHGVLCGFLITLSSTAIVLQFFQQHAQIDTPQGHICLAILIYQDLIVVPMMLFVPVLAGVHYEFEPQMLLVAAGSLGLIVAGFLTARKLVPYFLAAVVHTGSRELFTISILALGLTIALLTSSLGLSLALGAFLAGIILAESEYSQNAMEGIVPLKDIFTSLFFISVGMLLNIAYAFEHVWLVLGTACAIILLKGAITTGVTKILGYPWRIAIIVGLGLSQVGEFSFVLAKQGVDSRLISQDHYQLFLAASIVTMALAPFILSGAPAIARRLTNLFSKQPDTTTHVSEKKDPELHDHLIIVGFGLGGKYLAQVAKEAGINYVILEMNPDTVRSYRAQGEPIHYGDGSSPGMLRSLHVNTARVMAIVISDQTAAREVVRVGRRLNSRMRIVVRSLYLGEVESLQGAGANDVVSAEFEASLEIFNRVLSHYLVPRQEIGRMEGELRSSNYHRLRTTPALPFALDDLKQHGLGVDLSSYVIAAESELCRKTLADGSLRQSLGLSIIAVQREDKLIPNPAGDFRLECDDVVYLLGPVEKINQAAAVFRGEK